MEWRREDCRTVAWAALTVLPVSESTNADLKARAEAGAPDGAALRAVRQTGGKGREGRAWESPEGNLYLSFLKRPVAPKARWAELSFLTAVALAEVLDRHTAGRIAVKWPNDLLLDGRKISGILLETAGDDGLVIGVGVNVLHAPTDDRVRTPAAALAPEADPSLTARICDEVLVAFGEWYSRWERYGFEPVRARWVAMAFGLGTTVDVAAGEGRQTGRFEGLDTDGALLLDQQGEKRRILAGDVIFPTAA